MNISEVIRNLAIGFAGVFGIIVGLPILKIVWEASKTVREIQTTAVTTTARLEEFMDRVSKILERHDDDIEELKLDRARHEGFAEGRKRGAQRFDDLHGETP